MTTANEHQNLIDMLKSIGLRDEEARVYLACLELGSSSVWNIYLKCGLKRPTCYVILDDLVSRGLATKSFHQKKAIYAVVPPVELANELERNRENFKDNLSQFEAVSSKSTEKPKISLYEGIVGVKQAYNNSLNEPDGTEIFACSNERVLSAYPDFFASYIVNRIKKKIKVKLLLTDIPSNHNYLDLDSAELRETRFLPRSIFDPRGETEIYNNKIVNIAYSESNPFATVIESASMAYDEKERFDILWNLAEKREATE